MVSSGRIIDEWCEEMGFYIKRRKIDDFRASTMYGKTLALVREVKYLGVALDSKLSWGAQIN